MNNHNQERDIETARLAAELDASERIHDLQVIIDGLRRILADRERELAKGPCTNARCRLHYAHSGPCWTAPTP